QAVVQYEITAPDGSHEFAMRIAEGRCEIEQGRAESPRVSLRIGLADFLRLITGAANGMQLFMTGKLKVSGDLFFAQTYQSWFDRPPAGGSLWSIRGESSPRPPQDQAQSSSTTTARWSEAGPLTIRVPRARKPAPAARTWSSWTIRAAEPGGRLRKGAPRAGGREPRRAAT